MESIDELLWISDDYRRWNRAKKTFTSLRDRLLELEEQPSVTRDQDLLILLVLLAENVAKVVYNASNPEDPFDSDSGAWVIANAKELLDKIDDTEFADSVWTVATARKYLRDKPHAPAGHEDDRGSGLDQMKPDS